MDDIVLPLLLTGFGESLAKGARSIVARHEVVTHVKMPPLAPIGSRQLLPPASTGSKRSDWFVLNVIQGLSQYTFPFTNAFHEPDGYVE